MEKFIPWNLSSPSAGGHGAHEGSTPRLFQAATTKSLEPKRNDKGYVRLSLRALIHLFQLFWLLGSIFFEEHHRCWDGHGSGNLSAQRSHRGCCDHHHFTGT